MKTGNLLILLLIIFGQSCTPTSKLSKSGISFNEGDDLIYEVLTKDEDGDDEKYEIELNMNGIEDYYVSYDWEIFQERSGTIKMNENAIKNARALLSFNDGGYLPLENETTIWISQAVFKELQEDKKVEISLDKKKETFHKVGTETFSFGNKEGGIPYNIPVIIVKNSDTSIEIWIANDAINPIIVQMRMKDFRMDLVNYKLFK